MSYSVGPGYFRVEKQYADLLKRVGLTDAQSVFEHPKIDVWRSITERENCVLDYDGGRLHIKRNKPGFNGVQTEVDGIKLLEGAGIASVPLVGYGMLHDGRGFLITDDLVGFEDSEKRVEVGLDFDRLLEPTAQLAARLHNAGLHHRDLYLCHFYAKAPTFTPGQRPGSEHDDALSEEAGAIPRREDGIELRLMDAGRVRTLPRWFRQRWIVKDLAQFIYSIRALDPDVATRWLAAYASARGIAMSFRGAIDRKVAWIARHDEQLRRKQPTRNVAIDR